MLIDWVYQTYKLIALKASLVSYHLFVSIGIDLPPFAKVKQSTKRYAVLGSHYFYPCHTEASIVMLQDLAYKGPERKKNREARC